MERIEDEELRELLFVAAVERILPKILGREHKITPGEFKLLRAMAYLGLNREGDLAEHLGVKQNTVEDYKWRLKTKIGLSTPRGRDLKLTVRAILIEFVRIETMYLVSMAAGMASELEQGAGDEGAGDEGAWVA